MKKLPWIQLGILSILITFLSCTDDAGFFRDVDQGSGGSSGSITKFAVHEGFMYVLNPNEVLTYDLTNEDDPELVHQVKTEYGLESIFVYDDAIYLGSNTSLYILDITQPARPFILSKTDRSAEFIDGCDPVVVKDNFAYSTVKVIENVCGEWNSRSALLVFNVADKRNPVEIGAHDMGVPNGLAYQDDVLFVCDSGTDHVRLFDISDPYEMSEMVDLAIPVNDPIDLIINEGKMIVSAATYFEIYNIRNVESITKVGRVLK